MDLIWQRIETWLKINAPGILTNLEVGASETEIKKTEAILGIEFPEDFKASYLIHNGLEELNVIWMDGFNLICLERIVDEWQIWQELFEAGEFEDSNSYCQLDRVIKTYSCWNPFWIPIACNGSGDNYCLDLDPDINGNCGQIITLWHDCDNREKIAIDFRFYLEKIAADLENGLYIYNEEDNYLKAVENNN